VELKKSLLRTGKEDAAFLLVATERTDAALRIIAGIVSSVVDAVWMPLDVALGRRQTTCSEAFVGGGARRKRLEGLFVVGKGRWTRVVKNKAERTCCASEAKALGCVCVAERRGKVVLWVLCSVLFNPEKKKKTEKASTKKRDEERDTDTQPFCSRCLTERFAHFHPIPS